MREIDGLGGGGERDTALKDEDERGDKIISYQT